jgi:hypothetical protein
LRNTIAPLDLDGLAASTAALLAPFQEDDPRLEHSEAQIAAELAATRDFIADRPGEADTWLFHPLFFPPPPAGVDFLGAPPKPRSCPKGKRLKGGRCVKKRKKPGKLRRT